jgi:hypothetical protein
MPRRPERRRLSGSAGELGGAADRFPGRIGSLAGRRVGKLFNPDALSFFQGQIGAWRKVFTMEHQRLVEDRFGDVPSLYGYE